MPRDRQRLTLESGPKLDLAKLIPSGAGKVGSHIQCVLTYGSGETITANLRLHEHGGLLELSCRERQQSFSLVSDPRISAACNGTLSAQRPDGRFGCSIGHLERPTPPAGMLGAAGLPMRRSSWTQSDGRGASRRRSNRLCSGMRTRMNGSATQTKGHALGDLRTVGSPL